MKRHLLLILLFISVTRLSAQQDTSLNLQQQLPTNDTWWQWFGDPTLSSLIGKAIENNYNLQNSLKNIELAKARLRIQQSRYYPALSVSAEYSPEKSSLGIDHMEMYSRIGQAGLEMNWEIDVFGSIRKGVKAQKQYYLASQEDYRGAMVSLVAQLAGAYIQLRTYQQQLEVARRNLQSQEDIWQLNEAKLNAGLTSQLTAAQSKGLWLQTKATVPMLEATINSQANTVCILAGEYSDSLRQTLLFPQPFPLHTAPVMGGIPTELIRRRPDLRAAERTMDALAAAVGASRADWWPQFFVTGSFGYGNEYFKQMFKKENMAWQISPTVKWTIFSGRQLVQTTRAAQIQLDEGINNYNYTLQTALQEVDDAMVSYNKSLQQLEADRQALEQIKLTFEFAADLYKKGLVDYQNVLDSQRNVLSYENTLVNTHSSVLLGLVQLYKALGGGWENNQPANNH